MAAQYASASSGPAHCSLHAGGTWFVSSAFPSSCSKACHPVHPTDDHVLKHMLISKAPAVSSKAMLLPSIHRVLIAARVRLGRFCCQQLLVWTELLHTLRDRSVTIQTAELQAICFLPPCKCTQLTEPRAVSYEAGIKAHCLYSADRKHCSQHTETWFAANLRFRCEDTGPKDQV